MPDIVSYTAIIGRTQLMPGIQPVTVAAPKGECLVAHAYPPTMSDPRRQLELDVSDCTVYTVTHPARPDTDYSTVSAAAELFEQALQAISEVTIWNKTKEVVGKVSPFLRQIGRLDAKYFLIEAPSDVVVAWRNPLFWADRGAASMMASFLGNMIVTNGPSAHPVPGVTRRVMASLDLINLGFYTESFVSLFSLLDDLTQEVIKAGMAKKGLDTEQQTQMLRAIKEERLRHFVANLSKLVDWSSLEESHEALFKRLLKANTLRNTIIHGSTRLTRAQAVASCNTLLDTLDWLRTNPFDYAIPSFPLLALAEGEFMIVEVPTVAPEAAADEGA